MEAAPHNSSQEKTDKSTTRLEQQQIISEDAKMFVNLSGKEGSANESQAPSKSKQEPVNGSLPSKTLE